MLTARSRPADVLQGFEAGADDYLPKPFELQILLARLRGLLRRRQWMQQDQHEHEQLTFAGKTLDLEALELRVDDKAYQLTQMECDLLQYLVRNAGRPVSRKAILEDVWDLHEDTDTRAIDNFIVRLRRYLEEDPAKPKHLLTVRGIGYKFVELGMIRIGRLPPPGLPRSPLRIRTAGTTSSASRGSCRPTPPTASAAVGPAGRTPAPRSSPAAPGPATASVSASTDPAAGSSGLACRSAPPRTAGWGWHSALAFGVLQAGALHRDQRRLVSASNSTRPFSPSRQISGNPRCGVSARSRTPFRAGLPRRRAARTRSAGLRRACSNDVGPSFNQRLFEAGDHAAVRRARQAFEALVVAHPGLVVRRSRTPADRHHA